MTQPNRPRATYLARAEEPEKNWKFSASDMAERNHWDKYQDAYETMIRNTATKHSPWYVVQADNKWFTRVVVAAAVIDTLVSLDLAYPEVDSARLSEIAKARKALLASRWGFIAALSDGGSHSMIASENLRTKPRLPLQVRGAVTLAAKPA